MHIYPTVSSKLILLFKQLKEQGTSLTAPLNTTLTELSDAAKKIGFEFFDRGQFEEASFYLTFPALNADVESQYAMATCTGLIDGSTYYPSQETKEWLRLAAAQDNVLALMWLGDTASLAKARRLSLEAAAIGNVQSMLNLYTMTHDVTWLTRSAETRDPRAQFKLATTYRDRPELVPNAVERAALIEELLQKAADRGYPLALYDRVFHRPSTATMAEKQRRLSQLASAGDVDGLMAYGYALAGMPQVKNKPPRTYGFVKDLPKAWALLTFAMEKTIGFAPAHELEADLEALSHQVDPQHHEASLAFLRELQYTARSAHKYNEPLVVLGYSN